MSDTQLQQTFGQRDEPSHDSRIARFLMMTMGVTDIGRLHRDFASLLRKRRSLFYDQVTDLYLDGTILDLVTRPSDGIYKDCAISFTICLDGYPRRCPEVRCRNRFLHPNIDQDFTPGIVCLDMLDNWNQQGCNEDLELLVQGILFLLHEPNLDDVLFTVGDYDTIEELAEEVELTKHGTQPNEYENVFWGHLAFDKICCIPQSKAD